MKDLESIPEPDESVLYLLTAEEYLGSIGPLDEEEMAARHAETTRTDLEHEIDAQIGLIDELVAQYTEKPDEGLAQAIEEAKMDLGHMLVDKGSLPPA